MRRLRRSYYDFFSHIYDWVIKIHSADKSGELRKFLLERSGVGRGDKVLDLCTGTGAVALEAAGRIGVEGLVVGVDFSRGMLEKAKQKASGVQHVCWVEGNVAYLSFGDETFDVVLCSHAFYELKDREKYWTLGEVRRVLKSGGRFCMMEHEEPEHPFVRFLYRIRLFTIGSLDARRFVAREMHLFSLFFPGIKKERSPSGNSKLLLGVKI